MGWPSLSPKRGSSVFRLAFFGAFPASAAREVTRADLPAQIISSTGGTSYRPHIDGLRAIAVLSVVLFHLDLIPSGHFAVRGGFVGVDIFFVISGFLISKIIFAEQSAGTFSLLNFYSRRAKRILPALLFVGGMTMVAGFLFLYPPQYARLSNSLLAALGFAANIYFYETMQYFGPGARELPLLHLWSLGVEEQFYAVFPIAVIVGTRVRTPMLLAALAISLVAAQWQLATDPAAAFYLSPFRAWELLIGSLLALPNMWKSSSIAVSRAVGIAGLLMVAWSIHYTDPTAGFPGLMALPPCVGSAMIIWSGECALTLPTKLLSIRPAVLIGRWSYSIYLYHWPLLFFASREVPDGPYNGYFVLAASLTLAGITYLYIEQPARHIRSGARVLQLAAASLAIAVAGVAFVSLSGGLSWSRDPQVARYLTYLDYRNDQQFRAGTCFLNYRQSFASLAASCLAPAEKPIAVLWGDSGAAQYASELDKAASARGFSFRQVTAPGCPPVVDLDIVDHPLCRDFNSRALDRIIALHPTLVILGAVWSLSPNQTALLDHLDATISRLEKAGLRIIVLGLGPVYKSLVPQILADRYREKNPSILSDDDLHDIFKYDAEFTKLMRKHPSTTYVSIMRTVCPNDQCPLLTMGIPVHFDMIHVTEQGSKLFVGELAGQIFESPEIKNHP
jgi:peptidoglycan/LPS O-acetylase OafA/YrhL